MTDFKVGDRVRDLTPARRDEGTVTGIRPNRTVSVRFDKYGSYASDTDAHTRDPEKIELVETALARQAREYREEIADELEEAGLLESHRSVAPTVDDLLNRGEAELKATGIIIDELYDANLDLEYAPGLTVPAAEAEAEQIRGLLEDDVKSPAHYNSGKIEVWDFIYDQGLGYAEGNAVKYITRAGKKAGNSKVKDLRKAVAFLEREIRFEETGE